MKFKNPRPKDNMCPNDPLKKCRCRGVCKNIHNDAFNIDEFLNKI